MLWMHNIAGSIFLTKSKQFGKFSSSISAFQVFIFRTMMFNYNGSVSRRIVEV